MVALCLGLIVVVLISLSNVVTTLPSEEFLKHRFASIADKDESSSVAHFREWEVTFNDTAKHPILGLGLGSEHSVVPGFETLKTHTVHNAFVMLWMKMGIFSLILFVWCLMRYLRFGIRVARAKEEYDLKPLQIGLVSTFGNWVVMLNVGPSWFYYQETFLMALVIAVVVNLSRTRDLKASRAGAETIQGDRS
jgi:O-antigen ligase